LRCKCVLSCSSVCSKLCAFVADLLRLTDVTRTRQNPVVATEHQPKIKEILLTNRPSTKITFGLIVYSLLHISMQHISTNLV
jgi:hypothetical protein